MSAPAAVYRSRNSQATDYYRCVEDKPSSGSTRNGLSVPTDSSVPISGRSFTVILIAAICTMALPV